MIVLANALDYDGTAAAGIYTGAAQLYQGDTSIKGETIIDRQQEPATSRASGGVTTTTVLEQVGAGPENAARRTRSRPRRR